MVRKLLPLLILLLLPGWVWGATYYVNGSGAQYTGTQGVYAIGNDTTGDGTLAKPWATLQKANVSLSVAGGDRVYAAAGRSYASRWLR